MNKIFLGLLILAVTAITWSCGEEENMEPIGKWDLAQPVLGTPSSGAAIVLDQAAPATPINFEWQPALATNRFQVAYKFVLLPAESDDVSNPILEITPGNNGKELNVKPTAEQIDYALWAKCYAPGAAVPLKWVVVATAIEKQAMASSPVTITRFAADAVPSTLFISGSATEVGADPANGVAMRARKNADNEPTGVFDVYTTLTAGSTYVFRDNASANSRSYGGSNGTLSACGAEITVDETAQYRVTVDLNNNTYELWKVEKWSLVGDAVEGGWGGDVPLAYKGGGIWEGNIDFLNPNAGWIFRANGDWGYIIKRIKNTVTAGGLSGQVFMESEAGDAGVEIEDLSIEDSGIHTVTLDLSADAYTFTIVPVPVDPSTNLAIIGKSNSPTADAVSGNFVFGTYTAPDKLFLLSNGTMVAELTKDGSKFTSTYLALEKSKQYTLNSESDGTGTTYNNIGDGNISIDHDQAYTLTVDFESGKLSWKHYNLKVFHWDEVGGGWDQRNEYPMTYVHPYTYQASGVALTAGFHTKLNSPWDIQFGTNATTLTGTMENSGSSPNFKGIVQSGNYNVSIVVSDDFSTGTYSFVKQ